MRALLASAQRLGATRQIDDTLRLPWLKAALALGLLSGLLLSSGLWTYSRHFPVTPVWDWLPRPGYPLDYGLYVLSLVLSGLLLLQTRPKIATWALVILLGYWFVSDQSRWQPWSYQYAFMLVALGGTYRGIRDENVANTSMTICRLMMASVYLWGGLQKLNPNFVQYVFPAVFAPITRRIPGPLATLTNSAGVLAPLVEAAIGPALLIGRLRHGALLLAIGLHVVILLVFGPLGHNTNTIVWAWNATMICFVTLLFWKANNVSFRSVLGAPRSPLHCTVALLFIIMPAFSFANLWDSYLSWTLFSGNTNSALVHVAKSDIPTALHPYTREVESETVLDPLFWSLGEMNVPVYPEARIFKRLGAAVCEFSRNRDGVRLVIQGRPSLLNRDRTTTYTCDDL